MAQDCVKLLGSLEKLRKQAVAVVSADAESEESAQQQRSMVGVTASGVINLADAIASGLHVNRHYVDETGRYDPRLLVFEFVRNVVLRKGQVDVVQGFSKALRDENLAKVEAGEKGKDVHLLAQQMLMGQGKTAIITPLLCLVLADGEQLPVILLPDSLLDAARNIVRSSFVTVVKKRVYTLSCSRAASADQRFINMMENALRSKGVMITTPTSTKSISGGGATSR